MKAQEIDLSIIISTRNRAGLLEGTLTGLRKLELTNCRVEVIVVDNGSVDSTPRVLEQALHTLPLVVLHEPSPGKNRALNKALGVARGALLLFTDDDVIPHPKWAQNILDASRRWPTDAIFGGPISPIFTPETPLWMQEPSFPFTAMAFCRYEHDLPEGPICHPPYGPNLAIRAGIFEACRYDGAIGPDGTGEYIMGSESELLLRLGGEGKRFIYVPSASVHHVIAPHQTDVDWLVRRAHRAGLSRAEYARDYEGSWLLDAPRYLWRQLIGQGLKVVLASFRGPETQCIARMRYSRTKASIIAIRRWRRQRPDHDQ